MSVITCSDKLIILVIDYLFCFSENDAFIRKFINTKSVVFISVMEGSA